MLINELPDTLDDLALAASAGDVRSPGLHLSQIIRSIMRTMDPETYKEGPVNPLYTDPGFTFERVLEMAWSSRMADLFRPGEFELDGITGSPDYVDFRSGNVVLVESKMTEMSMKGCPTETKFKKWLWQIAGYCKMLDTRYARLHVLFLRGDYKAVRRAYKVYEIEWTPAELDHTWAMLVQHARDKGWLR